ncbi:MAG: cytochrome c biogenesis protein CcdA [Actinomycetota bacterium]
MNALGPLALALVAGVISISSPCCLPLMPGYVSFIGGVSAEAGRRRVLGVSVLFVAGFALVFTALGAGAALFGSSLITYRQALITAGGVFVIAMGLVLLDVLRFGWLLRERRLPLHRLKPGPVGALPLGMAFAIGWTPCIGPILASILLVASAARTAAWGATLLFVYSVGLGVPFVLLALGLSGSNRLAKWLRVHARGVEIVGGSMLVVMGLLMITGYWLRVFIPVIRIFSRVGWPPL